MRDYTYLEESLIWFGKNLLDNMNQSEDDMTRSSVNYHQSVFDEIIKYKDKPFNHGKRWKKEDEDKVVSMFNEGKSYDEIADSVGRKMDSVKGRLCKFGLISVDERNDHTPGLSFSVNFEDIMQEVINDLIEEENKMYKQNMRIQIQRKNNLFRVGILNKEFKYEWSDWYVSLGKAFNKASFKFLTPEIK